MTDTETSQAISPSFVAVGDRAQQLDMLLHLQEFSSMVVLLTGPTAIGKSAMLLEAQSQLHIHHQVVFVSAHKLMGENDLFQHIAESLGCSASEAGIGLALNQAQKQQETVHVLVDDAHLLESEALQYLVEVAASEYGWHLILAGDERIESQLRILQARIKQENLFHTIHLYPLAEDELQIFLTEVYRQMGQDTLPLSQQRIHQLWTLSEGIPGKVLDYIEIETDKANSLKGRIPFGHIAAMLLVGVALYVSYSLHDDGADEVQDPIAALLNHAAQPDVAESAEDRLDALLRGAAVPTSAGVEQDAIDASGLSDDELDVELEKALLASSSGAEAHTNRAESQVASTTRSSASISTAEITDTKAVAKQEGSTASTVARPLVIESVAGAPRPTSSESSKTPMHSANRSPSHPLLAAPPKTYALQLLGVRKSESAQAFKERLAKQVGDDQISVYETRYKSAPWYVVVYGPFDDRQAATNAVKQLPKDMQKQRPWVRQLSKIQEDIRKAKQ